MPLRGLRPSITQSKRWNRCSYFTQTFWVRLVTLVDDYGRFEADPELLRSLAFPYGDPEGKEVPVRSIADSCQQMSACGLLKLYETEGKQYLQLLKWKERIRSDSKFPDPECCQMSANDSKCPPPTPTPTCTFPPTRSPTPTVQACVEMILPEGFPKTEQEAKEHCPFIGVTEEFACKVWHLAYSRGGKDSHEVPIRNFRSYLKTQDTYDKERKADTNGKHSAGNKPTRPSRNDGTYNANAPSLSHLVRRAVPNVENPPRPDPV